METELAALHPIVVHFAIGFLVAGVLLRGASLLGAFAGSRRLDFAGPAAGLLLLLGTIAAGVSVKSGELARGDAESVPGAAAAVKEHAEWADWTLRLFVVVTLLEAAGLVLTRLGKPNRVPLGV